MSARDPDSGLLAVEAVNGIEMREDHITHVGAQQWPCLISEKKMLVDSAEDPWRTVARASNHYSVGTGEIKYLASFLRRVDVAVCEHRNRHARLDVANGWVLGATAEEIRARAPVYRECRNAAAFRDACNLH